MYRICSVVVLNSLLLAGLAECGARVAEWVHPYEGEGVSFAYAPYRMLRMSRAPWPLNREGFRADELETYRGAFLVEFLGGSVCVGVGTDTGATLSERLEEALHASGLARARVLNLCQGGAPSAQELAIFIQYGLPLAPQVVLSFNGANDFMHPAPLGEDLAPNLPYRNREMRTAVEGGHAFAAHLALARVAQRLAARWFPPAPFREAGVPSGAIFDSYLYATGVVRTLTREQGGWHAVLLQPTLHFEKPWSEEERAMWLKRRPRDGAAISRYASGLYEQARARIRASTEPGDFYDLTRVFAGDPATVYSDSVHFQGSTGYARLAQEVERQGLIARIASSYRQWERSERSRSQESREGGLGWQP